MARVTVEDCLRNVKNRFELVMVAAKRARQLMRGKTPRVEWDNDKATVVALREIAEGHTNFSVEEPKEDTLIDLHAHTPVVEKAAEMEADDDDNDEDASTDTDTNTDQSAADESNWK